MKRTSEASLANLPVYLQRFGIDHPPSTVLAVEAESMSAESAQSAEREFDLDRWVRNTLGGVQQMREAAEGGMTDFEMAVSGLEQLEAGVREIRTTASSFKRRAESTRGLAIRRRAAGQRGLVQSMTEWVSRADEWLSAAETLLPAIHDARWEIMAIRAEREEAGDAPAFDSASELVAFLEG